MLNMGERIESTFLGAQDFITCFELDTDRPPEALGVRRARTLPGVEFWTISGSARRRTFVSDMFTACLVRAPLDNTIGKWWGRGEERPLAPGTVLLSEPGEAQYVTSADGPASYFTVCWHATALERVALELGVSGGLRWKAAYLEPGRHSDLLARLAAVVRSGDDPLAVEEAFAEATTELVLRGAETGAARRVGGGNHPGVRRAMEKLSSGFREPTTLDDLAKEARLSKYHFVRCFRQATGLSPHRYRKLLRVLDARRLLEGGLSVAEAAGQASFADASHLSRTFREWLGVTPGLWASAWRTSEPGTRSVPRTIPPPTSDPELERRAG
jgi:AraC-like DNA-binding protein